MASEGRRPVEGRGYVIVLAGFPVPLWSEMNEFLRKLTNHDVGRITRIERADGGLDYSKRGLYRLTWDSGRFGEPESMITLSIG